MRSVQANAGRGRLLGGSGLLAFALALGVATAAGPTAAAIARLDTLVTGWVRSLRPLVRASWVAEVSALGAPVVVTIGVVVSVAVLAVLRDGAGLLRLAMAGTAAGVSSRLLKLVYERARPGDLPALVQVEGFSYPSGHAVGAAMLAVSLALLAGRERPGGQRAALMTIALIVVALVCVTRVHLGVHYPSDVVGGTALGAGWALLLAGRRPSPRPRRASGRGRAVL